MCMYIQRAEGVKRHKKLMVNYFRAKIRLHVHVHVHVVLYMYNVHVHVHVAVVKVLRISGCTCTGLPSHVGTSV